MKFTVLVCTYNTAKESLKYTLDSIISQQQSDFEIIICDDGSVQNNEKYLVNYFSKKQFSEYRLVMNKKNRGTVKNLLSGIVKARGKYVKPIGAGDALKSNDVLKKVYEFMENNNSNCIFSDMEIFVLTKGGHTVMPDMSIPLKKSSYLGKKCNNHMLENVIVFNDNISGASMFYSTQYFRKLLYQIENCVKYVEDLVQYLILLSGGAIEFFPVKCVIYEIGNGISTLKDTSNNIRMITDKNAFLQYIFEEYPDNEFVIRRKRIENIDLKYSNKLVKGILKFLREPKWLFFRVYRRK